MKLEFSTLQLADWLIHGLAVSIAIMQIDSVNDRTLRPIPRAASTSERTGNIQGREKHNFLGGRPAAESPHHQAKCSMLRI